MQRAGGLETPGSSNFNSIGATIKAKYIVIHGIRIDKDHVNFVPETFGRLTTIGPRFRVGNRTYQVCQCNCKPQEIVVVGHTSLMQGHTASCGCLQAERASAHMTTHGKSGSPEHRIWKGIMVRCYNRNCKGYIDYGGRGIGVCARWREPNGQGFINFLADVGTRPPECDSIEREEVNGNYEPDNCRWVTTKEQARNKRNTLRLTAFGKTQCLTAWAEEYNIGYPTLRHRVKSGWDAEKALTTPPGITAN